MRRRQTRQILEVWNKADRLDASARTEAERAMARADRPPVLVSALTGEGIEAMLAAIDARFGGKDEILSLEIPAGRRPAVELALRQHPGARAAGRRERAR